jgi:hypothetical protein
VGEKREGEEWGSSDLCTLACPSVPPRSADSNSSVSHLDSLLPSSLDWRCWKGAHPRWMGESCRKTGRTLELLDCSMHLE